MSTRKNTTKLPPKTLPKLAVDLSQDQKKAEELISKNKITVLTGLPGSGKTLAAVASALNLFYSRQVDRIILTRPTVRAIGTEDLGAMPGMLEEKLQGYMLPMIDNMCKLRGKEEVEKLQKEGNLVYMPVQYMRGITIDNEILLIDESQNLSIDQIYLIASRLGKNSKMVFTGDINQIDFKNPNYSGFQELIKFAYTPNIEVAHMELSTNHRDPLVEKIIEHFSKLKTQKVS